MTGEEPAATWYIQIAIYAVEQAEATEDTGRALELLREAKSLLVPATSLSPGPEPLETAPF